ncbi:MAG: helix-turn-helix transcriptional regulator [Lachnospiraceae bacterium]|nr:helix-turn-helix transcriptional regulator [Lachnospiraceae bacterium]
MMTNEELKLVIASNLIKLRQNAGLTQAQLGEQLNYSDKTVSKWERAESTPDAYVLCRIAEIYGTSVDALFQDVQPWLDPVKKKKAEAELNQPRYSAKFVILVAVAGIVTLSVLIYIILSMVSGIHSPIVFGAGATVAFITALVLNSALNKGRKNMYIVLGLVASIIILAYLCLLPHQNTWQLFLLLIPASLVVILSFHIPIGPSQKPEPLSGKAEVPSEPAARL